MDLSKLPKLSDTKSHVEENPIPIEEPNEASPVPVVALGRRSSMGQEYWLNLIIGVVLLMMGRNFAQYTFARLTLRPFHTHVFWQINSPRAGQEVEYFDLYGFTALSDMGIFLFGAVVLLEVVVKILAASLPRSEFTAVSIEAARLFTLAVIGLNCYVCYRLIDIDVTPVISGLAVLFGGWMLFDLSRLLRLQRQ